MVLNSQEFRSPSKGGVGLGSEFSIGIFEKFKLE